MASWGEDAAIGEVPSPHCGEEIGRREAMTRLRALSSVEVGAPPPHPLFLFRPLFSESPTLGRYAPRARPLIGGAPAHALGARGLGLGDRFATRAAAASALKPDSPRRSSTAPGAITSARSSETG